MALQAIGKTGPAPGEQLMGKVPPPPVNRALAGAPVTTSVRLSGLTDATVPWLVTVTVHSTDCIGPLTHTLVTFKSGPV